MIITTFQNNSGDFQEKLKKCAIDCCEVSIVSAFFTYTDLVECINSSGKKLKLTVSIRPPTSPKALKIANDLENVELKVLGRELHSKIYSFKNENGNYEAALGSSNMTENGMFRNVETNIFLEGSKAEEAWNAAEEIHKKAQGVTEEMLEDYQSKYDDYEQSSPKYEFKELDLDSYIKTEMEDV